mmetsp:Transcript_99179/g.137773  ORF Transcript_99179/g.137773 Transcript_99179/m.137773 type:complete len:120 (+) Transcript_99179:45-404(+)
MAFEGIINNDAQKEDMAVSLAVLLIKDAGKDLTKENLDTVVGAAGIKVQAYWSALFSKLLTDKDLDEILLKPGVGGPAPGAAGAAGAAEAAPVEEEEEEEEEEESVAAAGMFGDSESSS